MSAFLILALAFVASFIFGYFIERLKIPWVFAALIIGIVLSMFPGVVTLFHDAGMETLAYMGMLLLLFNIGLELDLKGLRRTSKLVLRATAMIILAEAAVGTLLVHYLFGYGWAVSLLVALSFATVGEAVLVPILEEFQMVNSRLGQFIIGVGTLDDVFELFTILWTSTIIGLQAGRAGITIGTHLGALVLLFLLAAGLRLLRRPHIRMPYPRLGAALPIAFSVFFVFVGIGELADLDALAALLAGIAVRAYLPHRVAEDVVKDVRVVTYGFFAPIFFLWVGMTVDITALAHNLWLALVITGVTAITKVVATTIATYRYLDKHQALTAGIGLCVRFSTSIVILKLLLDAGIIHAKLYSVLVASTTIFTVVIPFIFAYLVRKHARGSRALAV